MGWCQWCGGPFTPIPPPLPPGQPPILVGRPPSNVPRATAYGQVAPEQSSVRLPGVPNREIPFERIAWHPVDIVLCTLIADGFILGTLSSVGFNPVNQPLSGLLVGMAAGFFAQIYYVGVWGVECKFCKSTTPTETGRCAVCLAPLDADPTTFHWEPAPAYRGPRQGPGPHGDKDVVQRSAIRWRGNKAILAREAAIFFFEVVTVGLLLEDYLLDLAFPPAGSPGQVLPIAAAALVLGILRPAMNRRVRRWRGRRGSPGTPVTT